MPDDIAVNDARTREIRSCLASAASWRQAGENLRDLARARHLVGEQAAALLREAEAADHQAEWWLRGAAEAAACGCARCRDHTLLPEGTAP